MKRHRNLGEMGEALVRHWCAEQGLAANRADPDRTGWDFLIEFPLPPSTPGRALDRQSTPIQSLVQVKATDLKAERLNAKLSNWLRLANTPFPAFILLLQYHGFAKCRRAFLVEIDESVIREILRTLRTLSQSLKEPRDLHGTRHTLVCPAGSVLTEPSGEAFAERLRSRIGGDLAAYMDRKRTILRDVGYEDARAEFRLDIVVPEPYRGTKVDELLVDLAIGSLPEVDVQGGELWDVRFGIRGPEPERRFEKGGKLRGVPKPVQEDQLLLRSTEQGREARVPAKVYVPSGLGSLVNESNVKVRFELPNANLIVAPGAGRAQFTLHVPDTSATHPLGTLSHTSKLLLFMADASDQGWPVEFMFGTHRLGVVRVDNFKPPPQARDWATLISMASDVAAAVGLAQDTPVTPLELWPQRKVLDLLHIVLTNRTVQARIRFTLDRPPAESDTRFFVPQLLAVTLGPNRIFAVVGHLGHAIPSDEQTPTAVLLEVDGTVVLRKQVMFREEPLPAPESQLLREAVAGYSETHNIIKWWRDD